MSNNGWSNQNTTRVVIVEGSPYSGLFFYAPFPGPGNLVGSWTVEAGTDPYGNSYPDGLTSFKTGDEDRYLNIASSSIVGDNENWTAQGAIFFDNVLASGNSNQAQLQLISPTIDPLQEPSNIQLRSTSLDDVSLPATAVATQYLVPGTRIEGSLVQTDVVTHPHFVHFGQYSATVSGAAGLATFNHGCAFTPLRALFTPLTSFSQGNWSSTFGTGGFTSTQAQIVAYTPAGAFVGNGAVITFYAMFIT